MTKPSGVDLIAPWVQSIKPYKVEDSAGLIKLDAMENPFPFPVDLKDQWLARLGEANINRYPDPGAQALKDSIRRDLGVDDDTSVIVGNGSDELIHLLCQAFNREAAVVMSPIPSFAVYPLAAQAMGMDYVGIDLDPDGFAIDLPRMLAAIEQHQPALIFLASPNNPTGNRFDNHDVREICDKAPGLVVLDEAYWRFSGTNCVNALGDIDNLVFMHTLSKIGLAGIRIGALLGPDTWIEPLDRIRLPYNVGTLAQETALFALEHAEAFGAQILELRQLRERLLQDLSSLSGVKAWPSDTNFILIRLDGDGPQIHQALRERGVLVKNLHGGHPYLDNCIRVSIGTAEENGVFLDVLTEIVG